MGLGDNIDSVSDTSEGEISGEGSSFDPSDFMRRSSLYKEFMAEREAILKYKEAQSKNMQKEISFEEAHLAWIRNHRNAWRAKRRLMLKGADSNILTKENKN